MTEAIQGIKRSAELVQASAATLQLALDSDDSNFRGVVLPVATS